MPNCYYGVFQDGRLKCRGIMARRGDTPAFIRDVQMNAIDILAQEHDFDQLPRVVPDLVAFFQAAYEGLMAGNISLKELVVSQSLSRDLADFKARSPATVAATQLQKAGKAVSAGQTIQFLHVKEKPFVVAWNLAQPDRLQVDYGWYGDQLVRAADEIFQPFGIAKETTKSWITGEPSYLLPGDFIGQKPTELPLLNEIEKMKKLQYYW